ncbi:hypothetical protein C0J52_26391 [Blattella germanica]|nr:hypothetical protein C0J52_26391 [Blattella germanica]
MYVLELSTVIIYTFWHLFVTQLQSMCLGFMYKPNNLCIVCSSQFVNVSTEQRTNIEFCVLLQKTNAETLTMLEEAYAEEAMKKIQVSISWSPWWSKTSASLLVNATARHSVTAGGRLYKQFIHSVKLSKLDKI